MRRTVTAEELHKIAVLRELQIVDDRITKAALCGRYSGDLGCNVSAEVIENLKERGFKVEHDGKWVVSW